jgi:DNA-binding response OmpR family regulator
VAEFGWSANCRRIDGYEAFERTRHWTPDLIVLDVMLPGMTGFQLVYEWAKKGQLLKVMVISGERTAAQDGLEAGKLGVYKYLPKPFTSDQLVEAATIRFYSAIK